MANLVIAEHDHGSLKAATLNVIAAAAAIGGDVHVLAAGHNAAAAAAAAACVAGVSKVLQADGAAHANLLPENAAAQVVAVAGGPPWPRNCLRQVWRRAAISLDKAQISDIIKVVDADTLVRPIYAGNATPRSSPATA